MWIPPPELPHRPEPRALYGSRLFDQPAHLEARARLGAFAAGPGPLAVEVGFDHAMVILDHARSSPETRWLGLEIRKRRVVAAAPHAPANCLLFAADARTVFHSLLADQSVDRVDILFPTPTRSARHLLLTEGFVRDLARTLRPAGRVTVATDVEGLHLLASSLFVDWRSAERPPRGPVLSRRERVCKRDGCVVYWASWSPPLPPIPEGPRSA